MRLKNISIINLRRYIFLTILIVSGGITALCSNISNNTPGDLDPAEIRKYEGNDLSSINEFRENSIGGPQYINKENYKLAITGLVKSPLNYSYDDVISNFNHYTKVAPLNCVEGWSVKLLWEGFLVKDLISKADPSAKAKVIIFKAREGYTTSFPIDYVMKRNIIIAYKMNGVTIPPERGFPFQLVAEDKWGYKWIKWITEIEISDNVKYLGYWEKQGYSNDGSLTDCSPGPKSAQPEAHPNRKDCCTCHSAN